MLNDLKYALRLLFKSPTYSALTFILMTLGLAICLYLFSFVHALAFKPLPFSDGEEIVVIDKLVDGVRFDSGLLDVDLATVLEESESFSESGLIGSYQGNITIEGKTYAHYAASIEPSVLALTDASPLLGRLFNAQDAVAGAPLVALLNYDLWQYYYANGKKVLGEKIAVNQDQATVIGVMPKGYRFPNNVQVWLPITRELLIRGDEVSWYHSAVAKLKSGVSLSDANDDVQGIMKKLAVQYPSKNYGISAYVETFQKNYIGTGIMVALWLLIFCALFLLLLTILNISAMLLSKSLEYSRETAMRRALGAPKYRLLIQMLWPSLIISMLSGGVALLITSWALQLTETYFTTLDFIGIPYWLEFSLEPFNFYISFIVIILVIFISGILPGIKASGATFSVLLRQSGGGGTHYYVTKFSRHLLKAEVALSAFILTIALVLIVNVHDSSQSNQQYIKENMLTSMLYLRGENYKEQQQRRDYLVALKTKIEQLPEVKGVAFTSALPGTNAWVSNVSARDKTVSGSAIYSDTSYIDEHLFSLLEVPLLAGRTFTEKDDHTRENVAIVSKTLANKLWPEGDVIGRTIVFKGLEGSPEATVVGLVNDIGHGLSFNYFAKSGGAYFPVKQHNAFFYQFIIDYEGPQENILEWLDKVMFEVDPNIPSFFSMSYEKLLNLYSSGVTFSAKLFICLASISLLLAGAGIYGVTSNTVMQTTRDIAIRRALGANNLQVCVFFLRTTMFAQLIALILGGVFAIAFCYWQLYAFLLSPEKMILIMLGVSSALFVIILSAVFIPLWKVLKYPPGVYLRND